MNDEGFFQSVKNFLFSNINKQFFIFLFFLLLSAAFWLTMTLNESYEKELKIPVTIVNTPKNVMLTSATVDTVRATVRDKGWVLLGYMYGEKLHLLKMNFKTFDRGNGNGQISSTDIRRALELQLENSSKISSIKPERLDFFYNNGERKRVPVHWTGQVVPEQLYFLSHVAYSPDSVDVYAQKEKLDSIRFVQTEQLNYVGFHDTLRVSCRLNHPSDVKVVPERVKIEFYTDVLTEEDMDIPVKFVNVPKGKVVRTFPAKVKVHFVAGASLIRTLTPDDFTVVADYKDIVNKGAERCDLLLRNTPQGVSRAALVDKQVDYLIEEDD